MKHQLAILLSTYNGRRFLPEQLESVLRQTFQDFVIVARDDGSIDESKEILFQYKARYPEKIYLHLDNEENLGSCASFKLLMESVVENKTRYGLDNAYIMFCDQDDIWLEEKIEIQMKKMHKLEEKNPDLPILVHSDLSVIDVEKNAVSNSFFRYQGLNQRRDRLAHLSIYNLVTGCTTLINEPLAKIALPIPNTALMHDWWLGLCAAAFGKRGFVSVATVRYRQHDKNVIGAQKIEAIGAGVRQSFFHAFFQTPPKESLVSAALQARSFLHQYFRLLDYKQIFSMWICSLMRFDCRLLQKICCFIVLSASAKRTQSSGKPA